MENEQREDLLEQIKGNVEMLKNTSTKDINILDVEYQLDQNFNLKEVVLTLTLGGPNIYLDCMSYTLNGYWGNERVEYPIFKKEGKARSAIDSLLYTYEEQFKANIS